MTDIMPAEGTEGHEHDWVDATATGARVAAYCDVWGCSATKPRTTPVVPDSAGLREQVRQALRAAGIASRWIGERARGRDWYDGVLVDLDEDDQMAALVDAVLAVVGQGVTAETVAVVERIHEDEPVITARVYAPESWAHLEPGTHLCAVVRSGEQGGDRG